MAQILYFLELNFEYQTSNVECSETQTESISPSCDCRSKYLKEKAKSKSSSVGYTTDLARAKEICALVPVVFTPAG